MTEFTPPTLSDDDVDALIEYLSQKKEIHKKIIELIIQTLNGLKEDRFVLARKLKELEDV